MKKDHCKILIIDDEPDILELMEEEFRYCGYITTKAISGNDAVQILKNEKVNIVLSDYKMPNGNGMVVLDFVNSLPPSERPLFFFVSGQADLSVDEAIHKGAKKFFSKPFDLDELIKQIESFLEK